MGEIETSQVPSFPPSTMSIWLETARIDLGLSNKLAQVMEKISWAKILRLNVSRTGSMKHMDNTWMTTALIEPIGRYLKRLPLIHRDEKHEGCQKNRAF